MNRRKEELPHRSLPTEPGPQPDVTPITTKVFPDGMIFRWPDGRPWRWKLCSMFRAIQRWDRGEDLGPLVAWTHRVGGNGWRVFCQYSSRFGPDPVGRSLSPARIREFVVWAAQQGLFVELTVLCDCEQLGMGFQAQGERLTEIVQAVRECPNVFVEAYNEPGQNSNGVNWDDLIKACGYDKRENRPVLMATGNSSVLDEQYGPLGQRMLVLDYMTTHDPRKDDWPVETGKTAHFLYEGWDANDSNHGWRGFHGPIVGDEPIGAAEAMKPGSRDNRPERFEDGGGGYGVGSAGATLHSTSGGQALVPGPIQTACAEAYFRGMDFFPADAPTGAYCHGGWPNHPLLETTDGSIGEDAGRTFGDGRAYVAIAMPVAGWTGPRLKPGWRIIETNGRGNLLKLQR